MRFAGAVLRVCVVLVVCVGSIGLAIVAFPLSNYRPIDESPPPDTMLAVLNSSTRRTTPASVELAWSESRQTRVGDASGRITELFLSAGVPIECGAPVVSIDGAARLALCGRVPPWRDVTASTTGPDADQLTDLLVGLGLLTEQNRASGARRAAAWKQLSRFVGLPASAVFHPSDVIWIGEVTTPSNINVNVGDEVSGDSSLFAVDAALQAATVHPSGSEPFVPTDWVFSIEGSPDEFPIGVDGSLDTRAFEATALSTMTDDDEDLPARIRGIIRLASAVSYAAVPPTALVTAADGSNCVLLANGGTVDVTVVESATGLVLVDADLPEGTAIRDVPPAGTTC